MAEDPTGGGSEPIGRPPPGPLGRWLARAPRYLYRIGLGRLLGRRFVMVEHIGRRTGLARQTVLEVVRHDPTSIDVAAAWGERSDWYRNLQATPQARISTGPLRGEPAVASVVDREEAASVFGDYAEAHPRAARALAKALGLPFDDSPALAAAVPLVRFTLDR